MKLTLKQTGYTYDSYAGNGEHILRDCNGKREVWSANKNHASFGLKWRNTHLEFVRSI